MKLIICPICKTEFKGRNNQIFCSIECKNEFHNSKNKETFDIIELLPEKYNEIQSKILELSNSNEQLKVELQSVKKKYAKLKRAYLEIKEELNELEANSQETDDTQEKNEEENSNPTVNSEDKPSFNLPKGVLDYLKVYSE